MKITFFTNDNVPALANAKEVFEKGSLLSMIGGGIVLVGTAMQIKGIKMHNDAVESVFSNYEKFAD